MNDSTERRKTITDRIAGHILTDLRCAAVTPSKNSWGLYDLAAPYLFGWMPPIQMVEDQPALLVSFCPELIAEITAWLDEEALDVYLTAIETFLDAMVAHYSEPPAEVYQRVQNTLYEDSPAVLDLISQVEMRALDLNIVPVSPAHP